MEREESIRRGQPEVFAHDITEIEGQLPGDLDGVLFRNGAGTVRVGADELSFLDGHGLVCALEVAGGRAFLRTAHVTTPVRTAELAAGRMTKRRPFTNLPAWRENLFNLDLAAAAGHDTFAWAGRVHATDAGGHFALTLPTLADGGEERWASVVEPGELVGPMPRDDHATGTLVTYTLRRTPLGEKIAFVEVGPRFEKVVRTPLWPLRGLVHDSAFSARWYVAVENAGRPSPLPALMGTKPLWWTFDWKDEAPTLLLVPRGREGAPVRIPLGDTPLRMVFHVANAWDDGDEVVVDLTGYDGPVPFDFMIPAARGKALRQTPRNRAFRVRANARTGEVVIKEHPDAAGEVPEVAPALHGKRSRAAWFAWLPSGHADEEWAYVVTRRVGRLDCETGATSIWDAGEGHLVSPPAFAPRAGADPEDGWLLAWDLDLAKETTDVVILPAANPAAGPVARLRLGVYLPAVSHCRFAPGLRVRG